MLLTHTTWLPTYYQGGTKAKATAAVDVPTTVAAAPSTQKQ
jgi:hypothetical protein